VTNLADDHVFYAGSSSTTSTELMRIKGNGNVGIGTSTPGAKLDVVGIIQSGGIIPTTDNTHLCGNSGKRWTAVYAVNGTIQTSDANEKDFASVAKVQKLTVNPAIKVFAMDEAFGMVGNQRQIVKWSFESLNLLCG
jgi:hypothetical protein